MFLQAPDFHAEHFAYEFLRENAPLKEGETIWTGLTRIAEKLKAPIYDTAGNVLWPEEIGHEKIEESAESSVD